MTDFMFIIQIPKTQAEFSKDREVLLGDSFKCFFNVWAFFSGKQGRVGFACERMEAFKINTPLSLH